MNRALAFATAVAFAASATAALAAGTANRVWVSGHGVDAAGCGSPTSPCRSLQYAHDNAVAAGGEIDVLDPAGYGSITITKAVSIINDGVGTAGVQATGSPAITINAGPGDAIYLRGLNIDGVQGSAPEGILFNSGGNLTIANCVVRHVNSYGIYLAPGAGTSRILVSGTTSSDNGIDGLLFIPQAGAIATLLLDHVTTNNDIAGIVENGSAATSADMSLWNVNASNNSAYGVELVSSGPLIHVSINSSLMNTNDQHGLLISAGVTVSLSRSVLDQNGQFGVSNNAGGGGVFKSTGDNRIENDRMGDISGPGPTLELLR